MIFTHTSKERGLWRGWLKNGQSLELSRSKHGWQFGIGVLVHSNDEDRGNRMLCLQFWRFSAFIPLGITSYEVDINSEPQWSIFCDWEAGIRLSWGHWRKFLDLPGSVFTVAYEQQMPDGSWTSISRNDVAPYSETHTYTYVMKSGEVQDRIATVSKRRHVLARRWLHRIGWPKWIKESIDVEFSDEVGDRTGSWKGGTIGCGYDLRPGETMLDSLRRMERERKL